MPRTAQSRNQDSVVQFSLFTQNKVGRLNEIIALFATRDIHILALNAEDTPDCSLIRLIVDYPEPAREALKGKGFVWNEIEVLAVEFDSVAELPCVTAALVQVEINILCLYPFLMRPSGKSGLVLVLEDNDLGADTLRRSGLRVLNRQDIAR